jgi:hypothetical protein
MKRTLVSLFLLLAAAAPLWPGVVQQPSPRLPTREAPSRVGGPPGAAPQLPRSFVALIAPEDTGGREIHALLLAGNWPGAKEAALRIFVAGEIREPWQAERLALLALAEAGGGDEDTAICHWQAAEGLDPRLRQTDLSAFPAPARNLRQSASLAPAEPGAAAAAGEVSRVGGEVHRPVKANGASPLFKVRSARKGLVVMDSIVDERGRVRRPVVSQALGAGMDAISLETVCRMRFRPATKRGMPVPVVYTVTMNFMSQ